MMMMKYVRTQDKFEFDACGIRIFLLIWFKHNRCVFGKILFIRASGFGCDFVVRTYARVYACVYVCGYVRMYVCMYVCMHVCTHVCVPVCMHVCMYVCE